MTTRTETDTLGPVEVPAEAYWGAQTARALANFPIGTETWPAPAIRALVLIKKAAAQVNADLGLLEPRVAEAIVQAAEEVADGTLAGAFPLPIWQSGSGTQTNMNANEVLAGRANEILTGARGGKAPVHPNDHVNMGQSSNDTIPTAMHIAAAGEVTHALLPALEGLAAGLDAKARAFAGIVKIGRTHLQDATPLTLGQVFSGYAAQVAAAVAGLRAALGPVLDLAQGGTAVGTGINTHPEFAGRMAALRGHRRARCAGRSVGRAEHDCGGTHEGGERHAPAGLRPALRHWGDFFARQ